MPQAYQLRIELLHLNLEIYGEQEQESGQPYEEIVRLKMKAADGQIAQNIST